MVEIKNSKLYSYTVHQTAFLLVLRIVVIEILMTMFHYSLRVILNQMREYWSLDISLSMLTLEVIILQIVNLYFLVNVILRWMNLTYTFNPKEVIIKQGVIATKTITYEFANLQSMTVIQSIIQKMFNFGTIKLFNPVLKEEVFILDIPDPNKYADLIQQHQPELTPLIRRQK